MIVGEILWTMAVFSISYIALLPVHWKTALQFCLGMGLSFLGLSLFPDYPEHLVTGFPIALDYGLGIVFS